MDKDNSDDGASDVGFNVPFTMEKGRFTEYGFRCLFLMSMFQVRNHEICQMTMIRFCSPIGAMMKL